MILFLYLFDEKWETKKEPRLGNSSLFCPLSPSLYQNDQKGSRACFLFPCLISSISASLVVTYVEERFGTL